MRPRPHSSTAKACRRRSGKGRETSASGARSAGTERQGTGWRCPHIGAAWMRPRSVRILSINGNQPQGIASPGVDILAAVKAWSLTRLWPLAILPGALLLGSCEAPGGISPIFPTPVSPNGQGIFNTYQEGTLAGDVTPFVVPVNKLIRLRVQGTDVIHSWWVPAISGKTDAVPGYDNFTWLKVDRVGTWRGECAELCGAGHSTMQIIVQSMSQYDYDVWVRKQQAAQK